MLISGSIEDEQRVIDAQYLNNEELEQILILIAESEKELQSLFRTYLSSLGMSIKTANSGHETLDYFLDSKKNGRTYNAIVLDTHLDDPSGLDVAKRIHSENPDQKMVIVTTTPKEYLPVDCLKTAGIKDNEILTMPFNLSKLVTALKN
jgi:two-component system, OmpR family, response regulator